MDGLCPGMDGLCPGPVLRLLGVHRRTVAIGAVAAVAAIGMAKLARVVRMRRLRAQWASVAKDVVVLHTLPRGNICPSVSTYALKLETFLRMANIEYQLDFEEPMGPKNKIPWITVNGEDYADSELIIQKLQVMFNKFPDANVPKEDKAVGLAMRVMLEEHFNWSRLSWRFIEDENMKGFKQAVDVPFYMTLPLMVFRRRVKHSLYLQGLGRHSTEELHSIMKRDMEALSVFLGEKPFLLGSEPQTVDCSVFGCLCQILYNMPGSPYLRWMENEFPNLRAYTERVKQCYWSDWNQCITKPNLAF